MTVGTLMMVALLSVDGGEAFLPRAKVRGPAADGGTAAPLLTGPMDKSVIKEGIHAGRAEVAKCYEAELSGDPAMQGKLQVRFTIGPEGKVTEAHVHEVSGLSQRLQDCVVAAVKKMKFEKPLGGGVVIVTYPFIFKPGQ